MLATGSAQIIKALQAPQNTCDQMYKIYLPGVISFAKK